ncbi:pyridoxal-phosphate dependent enzyme [Cryobacterium glaciale]|uniref:Pyridoxal-phosphate dependent enzyme n=1 Tax=Cryobacterium glaciale TaxID=1259145 RepID=A0A4R8UV71_9MICO|nr:threonine synthase [Cryobacterium glaciale]TFB72713.1 pyridoxal-phosphate dependent enzyme [Cryobacterium glaciale]
MPDLVCSECGTSYPVESLAWRCTCGGLLDVAEFARTVDAAALPGRAPSLWRYFEALPIEVDPAITLGEGFSPLIPSRAFAPVQLKLDFLLPTLSFKDRGAAVLATLARRLGVTDAMVDSSGNAGTAMAAYFGRAGIRCTVYVPEATSPGKLAQMRAHGATVELVSGSRADTSAAALQAAGQPGVMYASHVYHPYFLHGVKTYGYEIWEQRGRSLPETVVVPVGNGTMLLGCYLAFSELVAAGLAERMPRLCAVQASACSPLEQAMAQGLDAPVAVENGATIAEGIAIAAPPRGKQILAAVRATGGTIVSVTDQQTAAARQELADEGLFVEPTSAVCFAAVRAAVDQTFDSANPTWMRAASLLTAESVVVPLCGAGLKSPA